MLPLCTSILPSLRCYRIILFFDSTFFDSERKERKDYVSTVRAVKKQTKIDSEATPRNYLGSRIFFFSIFNEFKIQPVYTMLTQNGFSFIFETFSIYEKRYKDNFKSD